MKLARHGNGLGQSQIDRTTLLPDLTTLSQLLFVVWRLQSNTEANILEITDGRTDPEQTLS
jgi:hypothetical protein